jgi:hypothetical protein
MEEHKSQVQMEQEQLRQKYNINNNNKNEAMAKKTKTNNTMMDMVTRITMMPNTINPVHCSVSLRHNAESG